MANLILSATLLVAAIGVAVHFYLRHRRRRRSGRQSATGQAGDYAPRRDWSRSSGALNYSSFVFFDVDRDGRYGMADRPMGGIMVRLSGEKGHIRSERTNTNGFANFKSSSSSRRAPIRVPGTYTFAVSVPPGWTATGANDVQAMDFKAAPGSPAGIVGEAMVRPVGIAPIRIATGRVSPGASATIAALKAGLVLAEADLTGGAPFRFAVPDGADTLTTTCGPVSRVLPLSAYPADLGTLSPQLATIDPAAKLQMIGFDDVTPRGLKKIPSGYAGLNWFNLNALVRDFHGGHQGYVNGNTSGAHVVYTSSGHPSEFWSEQPFGFHSVMLTAAWLSAEGEIATIEILRGDTVLARDTITLSALTPVHYAPLLAGVTRVRLSTEHCWQMVLDDLVVAR